VTYLADVEDDRLDVGRDSAALVVHPLDARIEAAADSCRAGGAMLVDDETGIGPGLLGTMLAIERTRVRADLYVLGSGWAAGLPFGACVTGSSQLHWRGQACSNPLGAAITLAVLRVLKSGLVESAAAVGRHLALALDKANLPWVMAGEGLVWTIAAGRGRAEALVARCREVGLLVRPLSPDSVGLRPALVVSRADVDEAVGILGRIGGKWSKV
jgi:acetylornithine/succinyldiaminopimelate/putrescine aminotransferase